jgi:hypothetical protein
MTCTTFDGSGSDPCKSPSRQPNGESLKRNGQVGGWYDDAVAAVACLSDCGVEVPEGPNYVNSGPMEGLTWVYLKAP